MKKKWLLTIIMHLSLNAHTAHLERLDEQFFSHYSPKTNQPIGILLTAYNRPDYFKQALASLEQTPEAQTLPFFFVIDGGPNAKQKEHFDLVQNSSIKKKYIILRPTNYGNGRNMIDARRFMFEWCKFDKIIFFEDDFVITPEYITLTLRFHDWATRTYDNVGVVSCYNNCFLNKKEKEKDLNLVEETLDKYWGYCLDKNTYNHIKDALNEYEKTCLIDIPRDQSNGQAVATWMEKHLAQARHHTPTHRALKSIVNYVNFFENKIRTRQQEFRRDGQDIEMRLALFKAGKIKISTCVNRAVYIGTHGTHHSDATLEKFNNDLIKLDQFTSDKYRTDFTSVRNQPQRLKIVFVLPEMPNARKTFLTYQIQHLIEQGHDIYLLIDQQKPVKSMTNNLPNSLNNYNLENKIFYSELPNTHTHFDIIYSTFGKQTERCLDLKNNAVTGKLVTLFSDTLEKELHAHPHLYKQLVEQGDLFLTTSLSDKNTLANFGFNYNKIIAFPPTKPAPHYSYKNRVPHHSEPIRLITVSSLLPESGIEYTVYALKALLQRFPHTTLTIISGAPLHDTLKKLIAQLNLTRNIIIKKESNPEDILKTLDSSHIFLHPFVKTHTHNDPITNPIKEAMALGLPLVTTYHSGISELIDDGISGLLIPERNSNAMAFAINYLLSNPQRINDIGLAGRNKVEMAFNIHRLNRDLERMLIHASLTSGIK